MAEKNSRHRWVVFCADSEIGKKIQQEFEAIKYQVSYFLKRKATNVETLSLMIEFITKHQNDWLAFLSEKRIEASEGKEGGKE